MAFSSCEDITGVFKVPRDTSFNTTKTKLISPTNLEYLVDLAGYGRMPKTVLN